LQVRVRWHSHPHQTSDALCPAPPQAELGRLAAALEARAAHDRDALGAQGLKAARESARIEALQAAVLEEREEMRAAAVAERQALEEARAQRVKVHLVGGPAGLRASGGPPVGVQQRPHSCTPAGPGAGGFPV
jgi:hypothetical protein